MKRFWIGMLVQSMVLVCAASFTTMSAAAQCLPGSSQFTIEYDGSSPLVGQEQLTQVLQFNPAPGQRLIAAEITISASIGVGARVLNFSTETCNGFAATAGGAVTVQLPVHPTSEELDLSATVELPPIGPGEVVDAQQFGRVISQSVVITGSDALALLTGVGMSDFPSTALLSEGGMGGCGNLKAEIHPLPTRIHVAIVYTYCSPTSNAAFMGSELRCPCTNQPFDCAIVGHTAHGVIPECAARRAAAAHESLAANAPSMPRRALFIGG